MGPSFSEWVTRPRQILIIFAITLAVAAISTSNKIHRCHASKQAKYGTHKFKMRSHSVEAADGLQLNEDAVRLMAKEARAATTASGIHAALTGKEATIVNQISDQLVESVVEEDLEAEMAEELGIRGEAEGPEETSSGATEPAGGGQGTAKAGDGVDPSEKNLKHSKHSKHRSSARSKAGNFCPAIHRAKDGSCDRTSVPESLHKHFKGSFDNDLILTSTSLKDKRVIAVSSSPGKSRKSKLADVTKGLLDLLPPQDVIFGKNFTRCAVIGSSGILLRYHNGKEIDGHDMVLRFNSARTKGFEKHVGGKTTHRLTNSRNFGFRESKSEQVLVHLRTPGAMRALIQRLKQKNKSVLYGLNPQWYSYMDKNLNFLSTSGLNGILIALHRCESVRLYGFHVHPRHGVPYHYYNVKDKPANVGRDDNEWLVVKHLIENDFVELGEPCILECNLNESECQKCIKENQ